MAIQTATTGQLENAQRVAIAQCRHTMEHSAPCVELVEHMKLKQGEKQITVPKVAQMNASDLTDGVDLVDTEDIGMTTTDLTTAEVGLKVILTDKLVRQENEDVFRIVGRQMGEAMARKKDEDVIALFSGLNGGTVLGADGKNLTGQNASACIAWAKANKVMASGPVSVVHHPNAIHHLVNAVSTIGGGTYPIPSGFSQSLLADFYSGLKLSGVPFFEDGNIDKLSGYDSGYGAIFSKAAMVVVDSKGFGTERERDASLRATEVVVTADYGCFELDDGYGAAMQYEIGDPATNN